MTSDVLLLGCGQLGSDVGLRLAALGHDVAAVRRQADRVPPPLRGVGADLTREEPRLPPLDLEFLVVTLTARPRTEDAYRAVYVDGMLRGLDAVEAAGQRPERAVLVSSTGVYGDLQGRLDETTPPEPKDGPGAVLLEAERAFAERLPQGTVLRLSGLYGGGSARLVEKVRAGEVTDPNRFTNRIHRRDAASAVVHLLTMDQRPGPLYLGTDDEPALMGDVAAHLAHLLGAPAPPRPDPDRATGRSLSNARLRATGWRPTVPSFRDGYTVASVGPSARSEGPGQTS